jgi:hypothetical protein
MFGQRTLPESARPILVLFALTGFSLAMGNEAADPDRLSTATSTFCAIGLQIDGGKVHPIRSLSYSEGILNLEIGSCKSSLPLDSLESFRLEESPELHDLVREAVSLREKVKRYEKRLKHTEDAARQLKADLSQAEDRISYLKSLAGAKAEEERTWRSKKERIEDERADLRKTVARLENELRYLAGAGTSLGSRTHRDFAGPDVAPPYSVPTLSTDYTIDTSPTTPDYSTETSGPEWWHKHGSRHTSFEEMVNSSDYDTRVAIWAEQFERSESWVREHTSPTDSAREANLRLVRAMLRPYGHLFER